MNKAIRTITRKYRISILQSFNIVILGMTVINPSFAADGKALYGQRLCITCHGLEGKAPIQSSYPKLAGQNKDYLVQQIKDIQSGARNNGLTAVMKPIVEKVTAEEIEAIAEYISGIEQ